MISCRDADSMLSRRLDGELPSDLERDLSEHLQGCPACRSLERAEIRSSEALRSSLAVEGEVLDSLREAILRGARAGALSTSPRRFVRQALALAAGLAIGVLVWIAFVEKPGIDSGPAGDGTLFVEQRTSDAPALPVDGDPNFRWQVERLRAILTEPPGDADPSRPEIRIELERDRDLIAPVGNSWY